LNILSQRPVPPAVFVEHKLITPGTVDHFYPNDGLNEFSGGTGFRSRKRLSSC
jgi:hypothetical protein